MLNNYNLALYSKKKSKIMKTSDFGFCFKLFIFSGILCFKPSQNLFFEGGWIFFQSKTFWVKSDWEVAQIFL